MVPLIIGSLPEPNNIGGVAIFTSRLLKASNHLQNNDYIFYSTKNKNILHLTLAIYRSSFVHFNGSNPMVMFFISTACFLLKKKLILSIHGQVGVHVGISGLISKFFSLLERCSIKLAYKPVVGMGSISGALKVNKNAVVIPSFIKPEITSEPIVDKIVSSHKGKTIFCTNANRLAFDSNGNEIYGISYLVDYFSYQENSLLIVSDTSGAYYEYFNKTNPPNVIFINKDINFSYLLQKSSCFIRFTSTDGDSLSIIESLFLKVPVIATDCILRNHSCILCKFGNIESLSGAVDIFKQGNLKIAEVESGLAYYDALYEKLSLPVSTH
ncbi:hypothetical protein N9Q72_01295 [Gammaproteobacteria bacterium]|nr:hypothetical protein [Gammaproteobacteria bacterium]